MKIYCKDVLLKESNHKYHLIYSTAAVNSIFHLKLLHLALQCSALLLVSSIDTINNLRACGIKFGKKERSLFSKAWLDSEGSIEDKDRNRDLHGIYLDDMSEGRIKGLQEDVCNFGCSEIINELNRATACRESLYKKFRALEREGAILTLQVTMKDLRPYTPLFPGEWREFIATKSQLENYLIEYKKTGTAIQAVKDVTSHFLLELSRLQICEQVFTSKEQIEDIVDVGGLESQGSEGSRGIKNNLKRKHQEIVERESSDSEMEQEFEEEEEIDRGVQ